MKILRIENDLIKLSIDNVEDLWHLSNVIDEGDIAEASTFRTVKFGEKEEKKPMFISIKIEKIEFSELSNRLRLLGKIIHGTPEDLVQIGKYHTIEVSPGSKISFIKKWKEFQIKRIKQAEKETKRAKLRIVVLDDEHALFVEVLGSGIRYGIEIRNSGSKNDEKYEEKVKQFFGEITKEIESHDEKYIVAGPGFFKDNLKGFIKEKSPKLIERIIFESCSYAEPSGIDELLKKGALEKVLEQERVQQEATLIEEFMVNLSKDNNLSVYGAEQVKQAAEYKAIKKLLIIDSLFRNSKDAQKILELVERFGGKIFIFSSKSDYGSRLNGFGGIGAILKFAM